MPLAPSERRFLETIERFKIYLLLMAGMVFLFLLLTPQEEIRAVTSVIGMALCGIFWLTQRLLTYISILDLELTQVVQAVKRSLPEVERELLLSRKR